MSVQPIPDGFHTVTPYLAVSGVTELIEFVRKAFDAEVVECDKRPDGTVMHAQVKIGDSIVMMGEPHEPWKPMPTALYLYVPDCDAVYQRAIAAGAKSVQEPADMFYGDRHGGVQDGSGNMWWIATHVEDVPPDEMKRRARAHAKKSES